MSIVVVREFDHKAHEEDIRGRYKPMKLAGMAGVAKLQRVAIQRLVDAGRGYKRMLQVWPAIHEAGSYYTIQFTNTRTFSLEAYLTALGDLQIVAIIPLGDSDYKIVVKRPEGSVK